MTSNNASLIPYSFDELQEMAHGMPLASAQALSFSLDNIHIYLDQHVNSALAIDSNKAALMAAARLEWILQQTRHRLSGVFTELEFNLLMNCFQGDIFFSEQMRSIASDLCDDLGIDIESYETSGIAPLIDKLRDLDCAQRVTLADALEQAWHRGLKCDKSPCELLSELGIEMAETIEE